MRVEGFYEGEGLWAKAEWLSRFRSEPGKCEQDQDGKNLAHTDGDSAPLTGLEGAETFSFPFGVKCPLAAGTDSLDGPGR